MQADKSWTFGGEPPLHLAVTSLSVFIIPLALFMVFFAEKLLFIWTGDRLVSAAASPFLLWLGLGNAVSVLMNLVFLLQYSSGRLRGHVISYLGYSLFLIPISIFIASEYKATGAVIFWFVHNLAFFILWGGIVHRKYFVGITTFIWSKVIMPCVIITLIYLFSIKSLVVFYDAKVIDFMILLSIGGTNVALLVLYFWLFNNRYKVYIDKLRFRASL